VRNTCVTGSNKTQFIRRLLLSLACLYEAEEACFIVLSPHVEYGELLRLRGGDFTIPYIRKKEDLAPVMKTLKELTFMRANGEGYPHIFLVLDGLETLVNRYSPYCRVRVLFPAAAAPQTHPKTSRRITRKLMILLRRMSEGIMFKALSVY
jgi:hypothetical protein